MKKISVILLAAACICCSCKKDEEKELITLGTSVEDVNGGQKAYIDDDRYVCFAAGDMVKVNDEDVTIAADGKMGEISVSRAANYKAVYPKSILSNQGAVSGLTNVDIVLPEEQKYVTKTMGGKTRQVLEMPMCAYLNASEGTLYFRNLCSVLKVIVKNTRGHDLGVTSITVRASDAFLCGGGTISDIAGATTSPVIEMKRTNTATQKEVRLQMTKPVYVETGDQKEFYLVIPAVSSNSNKFTVDVIADSLGLDGIAYAWRYTKTQGSAATGTIARNKLGSAAFTINPAVKPGKPYIVLDCDASGVQQRVVFAPGNLQYRASDNSWRFAEHSYDIIGGADINWGAKGWTIGFGAPISALTGNNTPNGDAIYNGNTQVNFSEVRPSQSKWIDLFGWGTSGKYNRGGNAQDAPWCYFNNNWGGHDYSSDYGPASGDLSGDWDWGANSIYNPVSKVEETGWRTPTRDEWACLINSTSKFGYACFVDVAYFDASNYPNQGRQRYLSGIVLVPVGFVDPMCAQSDKNTDEYNRSFKTSAEFPIQGIFTQNIYRRDDWAKMAAAGAVFLPSCGSRGALGVSNCAQPYHGGQFALYWSTDRYDARQAYCFRMENGGYESEYPATAQVATSDRSAGCGVRLIKTVADTE